MEHRPICRPQWMLWARADFPHCPKFPFPRSFPDGHRCLTPPPAPGDSHPPSLVRASPDVIAVAAVPNAGGLLLPPATSYPLPFPTTQGYAARGPHPGVGFWLASLEGEACEANLFPGS